MVRAFQKFKVSEYMSVVSLGFGPIYPLSQAASLGFCLSSPLTLGISSWTLFQLGTALIEQCGCVGALAVKHRNLSPQGSTSRGWLSKGSSVSFHLWSSSECSGFWFIFSPCGTLGVIKISCNISAFCFQIEPKRSQMFSTRHPLLVVWWTALFSESLCYLASLDLRAWLAAFIF